MKAIYLQPPKDEIAEDRIRTGKRISQGASSAGIAQAHVLFCSKVKASTMTKWVCERWWRPPKKKTSHSPGRQCNPGAIKPRLKICAAAIGRKREKETRELQYAVRAGTDCPLCLSLAWASTYVPAAAAPAAKAQQAPASQPSSSAK